MQPEQENVAVLQKIIRVLGWPVEGWPDVAKLPQWPVIRSKLRSNTETEQKPLQDRLRSDGVQRPLGKWPEAVI